MHLYYVVPHNVKCFIITVLYKKYLMNELLFPPLNKNVLSHNSDFFFFSELRETLTCGKKSQNWEFIYLNSDIISCSCEENTSELSHFYLFYFIIYLVVETSYI